MATSTQQSGGIATYSVKIGGSTISSEQTIFSINVTKKANHISVATLVVLDGDASSQSFDASSSSTFLPGAEITIEAGYDSTNQLIFKGIITGQTIRIDPVIGSVLEVSCNDLAVKMTIGRKSSTFANQKDSDILTSIIGTYAGLTANVTATTVVWPEQVQYYVSDWDFLIARAEANGFIVTTNNGVLSILQPIANTTPTLSVTYGAGLLEFNATLNALTQVDTVKASAWDFENQTYISGEASNNFAGPGNLSSKQLSQVVGLTDYELQTAGSLDQTDLTNWSQAQMIKSELAKIQGQLKIQGTSLLNPSSFMTLAGLGDRFNGDHFVSSVVHDLSNGNWITEVAIGLSPNWLTEQPEVMAPPAAGLLPGARGIFTGTVKQLANDPNNQYRILVNLPLFDVNGAGIWARLSNFYSTNGAGAFFLPEIGDEVVVGFLNEDPRYPIILGSLYSSANQPYPGLVPNDANSTKAIVSKSGISLQFDDQKKELTIATPSQNTIVISDQAKQITIKDQNNNQLVMSSSGIDLSSPRNISISAGQNVLIKGNTGVQIEASSGDVNVNAMNIKETAQAQYAATGSLAASVKGGTELILQAAMVMIN